MLKDILLGQFFPGNSFLHKLDPRTKIICTLLFMISIFIAKKYLAYGVLFGFAICGIAVSGVPIRMIIRSLKPLWVIILLTLIIHILTTPGLVVYSVGFVTITREGLELGAMMASRMVLLIVMSSLLTFTTSPIALTDGLETLLRPFRKFKLPTHELAMMMTIALRFIPTLLEETERIMKAQMARGADFSHGNIIRRVKNLVPLLVPLFISAFRRADELATAMEARCYQGGDNRTRMKQLKISYKDWVAYGWVVVLNGLLVAIRLMETRV